ncbi:MAG: hypothetical protein CMH56_04260 [Myxococcales bacterium]|nr:hypothetical protein [Myxococcales bacterium]
MPGLLRPFHLIALTGVLLCTTFTVGCVTDDAPKRTRVAPSPMFNQPRDYKPAQLGPVDPVAISFALAEAEDAIARGVQKNLQAQKQTDMATSSKSLFAFYWAEADEYERWKYFNKFKNDHRAQIFGPLGICLIYTEWRVTEHAEKPCAQVRKKFGDLSVMEVAQGRYWEGKGNTVEALKHYNNAVEINSEDVSAHLAIGNLKAANGDGSSALKAWDRSIRAWPKCFRCYRAKAQFVEAKFGLSDALPIWEEVLKIAPEDTESLTRYAKAQVGRDDNKALFAYETALKGGKKDFMTYMAAAQIAIRLAQLEKSIGYLEEAVALDKTNRDAWWTLTLQYEKAALEDKYLEALNKMLEFEPKNDDIHLRLARLYHKKESMVDCLKHYRILKELVKEGQSLLLSKAVHAEAEKERLKLLDQLKIAKGFHGSAGQVVGTVQYRANKMFQQRLKTTEDLGGSIRLLVTTNAKSRVENVEITDDQINDLWMAANVIGNLRRAIIWGGAKRYNIELVFEK